MLEWHWSNDAICATPAKDFLRCVAHDILRLANITGWRIVKRNEAGRFCKVGEAPFTITFIRPKSLRELEDAGKPLPKWSKGQDLLIMDSRPTERALEEEERHAPNGAAYVHLYRVHPNSPILVRSKQMEIRMTPCVVPKEQLYKVYRETPEPDVDDKGRKVIERMVIDGKMHHRCHYGPKMGPNVEWREWEAYGIKPNTGGQRFLICKVHRDKSSARRNARRRPMLDGPAVTREEHIESMGILPLNRESPGAETEIRRRHVGERIPRIFPSCAYISGLSQDCLESEVDDDHRCEWYEEY